MTDDFRMRGLEKDIEIIQAKIEKVPVLVEKLDGMKDSINDLREETKSTRRTLIGFCVSVAIACIVGLIGVLQVVPH